MVKRDAGPEATGYGPCGLDKVIESLTLGESLYAAYISSENLGDLLSAISHYSNPQLDEVDRHDALLELIKELKLRSSEITDDALINRGTEVMYKCLDDPELGLSNRRDCVVVLVTLLRRRHQEASRSDTLALEEAMSHFRDELVAIYSAQGDTFTTISNLSILLVHRYEEDQIYPKDEDLLAILRNFVAHYDSNKVRYHPLFDLLSQLLVITMEQEHSDNTIFAITQYLSLIPADHRERPLAFHACYRILCVRFIKDDMKKLFDVYDIPKDLFDVFFKLAETLQRRSEEIKVVPNHNLNGAILCLRATILLPEPNTDPYIKSKRMLGSCLLTRYKTSSDANDLNEGNQHSMTYLVKQDDALLDLSERFLKLFDEEQDVVSLEIEITSYRAEMVVRPPPHPGRADTLLQIGYRLTALFKINGDATLIDKSIMHLREADLLSPNNGIIKMALSLALLQRGMTKMQTREEFLEVINLMKSSSILLPFGVAGIVDALISSFQLPQNDSVEELFSSVSHNTSHMRGYIPISDNPFDKVFQLATQMRSFYTFTKDIQDIDGCIYYTRQALELCPAQQSRRPKICYNLAEALITRFTDHTNDETDLDEALDYYRMSLENLPVKNYLRAEYDVNCGVARLKKLALLQIAGQSSESEMGDILVDIIRQYKLAALEAISSPISYRFAAARTWAELEESWNSEAALEAYNKAVSFLPRLSAMGSKLVERLERFKHTDGVSRNAALNAISNRKYDKAIEFLETGRAVFWQQTLQLRVPTDALRAVNPELETKFSRISKELEKATLQHEVLQSGGEKEKLMRDEETVHIGELNEKWDQVLSEIQKLDGFSEFLLPKHLASLQKCANHPVIYLVPNEEESHALIMLPDDVKHVHLPKAPYRRLQGLMFRLPRGGRDAVGVEYDPYEKVRGGGDELEDGLERGGRPVNRKVDRIKAVLEVLWHDVVGPIVDALGLTKEDGTTTRVTWCPTGIFSFLPVHAAGIYRDDMSIVESAVEHFISSYTPTVGSVIQDSYETSQAPFNMMVVTDPSTLPQTVHEMEMIEKHVPNNYLQKFGTKDSPALVDRVAENLSSVSIAHFACHGQQVTDNPLNSALKLQNGDLRISRIMEQRMKNAALAFLCACETAMGDRLLPDEAMHLGATLLFSGFRSVVATMWSINDPDGPVVADAFYAHLLKDDDRKVPDVKLSAEGVHFATAELRRRGVSFQRWVPFIHLGN